MPHLQGLIPDLLMLDGQPAMFEGSHIQHIIDPASRSWHMSDILFESSNQDQGYRKC